LISSFFLLLYGVSVEIEIPGPHDYLLEDKIISKNEKKTLLVIFLTTITMGLEIFGGYYFQSMALLADGWHMASHAGALTISYMTYRLARKPSITRHFSFGAGKFIPLGGYTSAILLILVSLIMGIESTERIFKPLPINFNLAIWVTLFGLLVNSVSAVILFDPHTHHSSKEIHDHNLKGAYYHVIADTLTSILALGALLLGKYLDYSWADPLAGLLGAMVVLKWGITMLRNTGWELLDGNAKIVDHHALVIKLEERGIKVLDLHIWRIAPKAVACELLVLNKRLEGGEYYKEILKDFNIKHLIIEEKNPLD
jgi:cation diffusion facilitator family transporter